MVTETPVDSRSEPQSQHLGYLADDIAVVERPDRAVALIASSRSVLVSLIIEADDREQLARWLAPTQSESAQEAE